MKFACPHCQQRIESEDSWAGQTANCPSCGSEMTVPPIKAERPQPGQGVPRSPVAVKSGVYSVKGSSFVFGYRLAAEPFAKLAGIGQLVFSGSRVLLRMKYDPRGTFWLALLLAILLHSPLVFDAYNSITHTIDWARIPRRHENIVRFLIPSADLCYFIILILRRRRAEIDLSGASKVVIDRNNKRLAFEVNYNGVVQWVAFEAKFHFDEIAAQIANGFGSDWKEGVVSRRARLMHMLIRVQLLIVIIALAGLALMIMLKK